MKRVAIIAPTGMLGSMVYNVLQDSCELTLLYRSRDSLASLNRAYGGVKKHTAIQIDFEKYYEKYIKSKELPSYDDGLFSLDVDIIINCSGIIKPYANQNPPLTFFINSALPQLLSTQYEERLIQITTDCVYSGKEGAPYSEKSAHTPVDLYGLSKSLGEPEKKSLVIRTSIIGPEISHFVSLISWFSQQKKASGFTNHLWNGVTTRQFALICKDIIENSKKFPKRGLFHIFSNDISKYNLLLLLKKKYKLQFLRSSLSILH
jgi:dTDP-4-dehydrorhamnose reductase